MERLVAFYERKTREILERYGPGPRVHYHTGFIDDPPPAHLSSYEHRRRLVAGQERMIRYAVEAWRLQTLRSKEILDVGCGLGGTTILIAEQFGARVTALSIVPTHLELVRKFAACSGVGSQVIPLLSDALAVTGQKRFDAALAIDSSSSFERQPWFECLARVLRPSGHVFIFDCFLEHAKYEEPFNRHWCARIGTVAEYLSAARESGFRLTSVEDVSCRALYFWKTTIEQIKAELEEIRLTAEQRMRRQASLRMHALVCRGIVDQGLRHLLMSFALSN